MPRYQVVYPLTGRSPLVRDVDASSKRGAIKAIARIEGLGRPDYAHATATRYRTSEPAK